MIEIYKFYDKVVLNVVFGWFDCFDVDEIGVVLFSGEVLVFLGIENIYYGIDCVIVVMFDG